MKKSPPTSSPAWTMNTTLLYRPLLQELIPSPLGSFTLGSLPMRHGLISKAKAPEDNLNPWSTLHRVAVEDSPEGVVGVALAREVAARQEDVVVGTHPTSQETNFLDVKSVARPITRSSSATSGLIPLIWVKRRMQMWQCLMVLIPIGMQIRVLPINDNEQIYNASGSGMRIEHVGESVIHTPYRNLKLKHVLHVPQVTKNLASVYRTTIDNVFFELHHNFFFTKDRESRRTLIHGRSKGGLYPIPYAPLSGIKQVLGVSKFTTLRWHSRVGHPSSSIVKCVLSKNNIPCVSDFVLEYVCDACQQAKSHQLPYPTSSSISTSPLELIFSDVWGPAWESVGRHKHYVSFIDDCSKFTWIYLLKHKYEVFQKFCEF
jgi:hypothetical protein